jgi:hypothetical protein
MVIMGLETLIAGFWILARATYTDIRKTGLPITL